MSQCQYHVVVFVDADGRDLCESLDLPCYPAYQCMAQALPYGKGFEMCGDHDDYASHWVDIF